ncbi:MAG TPA: hypothetical protein VGM20_01710 [Gemmatimonadales bacterium]
MPMGFVREQVARLAAAFGGKPAAELAAFAVELQRATHNWTTGELFNAITSSIQSSDHFPRIKVIKLHRAARETPQKAQGSFDVCNECGRHTYYAGFEFPDGTVKPRLRCDCPHAGAGWETEKAKAYVEQDKVLLAAGFGTPPDREEFSA